MITILHEQRVTTHPPVCGTDTPIGTNDDAAALWLDAPGIEAATGWQWKPEGLCQGDVCMPLPPAARAQWVRELPDQAPALNLAAMWRHSGQPVVHDQAGQTWVLGTGAAQRRAGDAGRPRFHAARSGRCAAQPGRLPRSQGLPGHLGQLVRLPA